MKVKSGNSPIVLIGKAGPGDVLDIFDQTLQTANVSFEFKRLGDADSEYAIRHQLE